MAHDDMVEDADTDVLEGLGDLVGGFDVLLGGVTLISGVISGILRGNRRQRAARRFSRLNKSNSCCS